MRATTTTFLRRTFVLLGAALALATGTPAMAQGKVTLSGASGNSCDYTEMKVTPNGNITVTCGTANQNVANFALSHASASNQFVLPPNTASAATVTRTGGPVTEALMVSYNVSGSGCASAGGGIQMLVNTSQTIPFTVGAAGTSCVVTIGVTGGGGHTASPHTITFTAATSGGGGPPVSGDCPAIPTSSVAGNTVINDFQSVDNRRSSSPGSGSILYYPVPPSNTASVKVTFDQGQTGASPAGLTEFQVSPCPGVWNPAGHTIAAQCRYGPSDTPNNVMTIWTAPATSSQGTSVQGQGDLQYLCYAPIGSRPYYVNVRYTYVCPAEIVSGYGGCGFSMKWRSNNSNGLFD